LAFTALWLVLGLVYISASDAGWGGFVTLPANEIGSFFEGAFAPLAFLWLVIGYFLQQKELQQNTEALQVQAEQIQKTAEQAVIQSERMQASESHARQEIFLRIADIVRAKLGSIAGLLLISSQGTDTGEGTVSPEEQGDMFAKLSARDYEVFSRRLMGLNLSAETEEEKLELFYGTLVRARHCNNFVTTFNQLLDRAAEVDPDGLIRDSLKSSGHGFLYAVIKRQQNLAPPELADPAITGTHIDMS